MDDCGEDAGAGHIGSVEFNSSTLYRYATVNVRELFQKLKKEEVVDAVSGFVEAFIKAMPDGKQNSFANRTLPFYTYVTVREDQPISMVGAFEKAVAKSKDGYENNSIKAFERYIQEVYDNYADYPKKSWVVSLNDTSINATRVKLADLFVEVADTIGHVE